MFNNAYLWIIKFLVLVLVLWTWAIFSWEAKNFSEQYNFSKIFIIASVVFLELTFILFFIYKAYEEPISKVVNWIKYFLNWFEKESNNEFNTKTINPNIKFIIQFFKQIVSSLKWIKSEFLHWKEIKSEVSLAKEIQWKMLQKKLLEVPSLSIVMTSKPAWEVGWDSFDILKSDHSENYYIYVWDATWHWVWAWFIMTMVNSLIEWFIKNYTSGSDILAKTNLVLKPRLKANLLMSLLLVRWDEENKRLFMTWAGHEYLIIYKQKLNKTFKIKSGWVALWMVKDISKILKEVEIKVDPGDIIVLYSDWVTEAINKPRKDWTEELFWEDRIIKAIQSAPNLPWEYYKTSISVYKSISMELSKFMWYKHTQLDDITLWVIQIKPKWFDTKKDFDLEISKEFIAEWNW